MERSRLEQHRCLVSKFSCIQRINDVVGEKEYEDLNLSQIIAVDNIIAGHTKLYNRIEV